jgi:two-component sensor histidine kinase
MQIESENAPEQIPSHSATTTGDARRINPSELLLLSEITHRINNELTSMIGFASLVSARSTNCCTKLALTEVIEQLREYARLHRVLLMPTENRLVDATAYLRMLCQAISRAKLKSSKTQLVFVEHPIRLYSLQCWRLGMIVSELITNSHRHAFGESGGTIYVELKRRGSRAECRVADNGGSSDIVRPGHGLQIVHQLADVLDGEFDLRFGENGTVALISFPVLKQVHDG